MIRAFYDKDTENLYAGKPVVRWKAIEKQARKRLRYLDAATSLQDLAALPSNGLHALSKDREGQHAIKVNQQYRLCFVWVDGGAERVELTDYR